MSDKFVEVWNSSIDVINVHYNTYTSLTADEIMSKQIIMNETIQQINELEYKSCYQ